MSTFILPLLSSSFQKSLMLQKLPTMFLGKVLSDVIKHDSSYLHTPLTGLPQHKTLCHFILSELIIVGKNVHVNIFFSSDVFYFGFVIV